MEWNGMEWNGMEWNHDDSWLDLATHDQPPTQMEPAAFAIVAV